MEETPVTDKPRPALRWYQFRLSSLIAAQLVAAGLIYLNLMKYPQSWISPGRFTTKCWGFPFEVFSENQGEHELWSTTDRFALLANILIWITLVLGTLVGLEILNYARRVGFARLLILLRPSRQTLYWAIILIAVPLMFGVGSFLIEREVGCPFPFMQLKSDERTFRWPEFVLDLYLIGLWVLIPSLLLRRERRSLPPASGA